MADLKDLLGDAYKEDMTFDDINIIRFRMLFNLGH